MHFLFILIHRLQYISHLGELISEIGEEGISKLNQILDPLVTYNDIGSLDIDSFLHIY